MASSWLGVYTTEAHVWIRPLITFQASRDILDTVAGTNYTYTLLGGDPAKGGTTTIPTVLAAITLTIDAPTSCGNQNIPFARSRTLMRRFILTI